MKRDVLFMEATSKGYVIIHMEGNIQHILSTNLGNVALQFDSDEFIRISRRYLVNRAKVTAIQGIEVLLGPRRLVMSKSGTQRLFACLPVLRTAQWRLLNQNEPLVRAV